LARGPGYTQVKVADLLDELERAQVVTRAALRRALKRKPSFLHAQLRACFRAGRSQQLFEDVWVGVVSKR
jgi:hypothetical protein